MKEAMKRDLELFFEKLLSDQEFREKFIATDSAKDGYEMAKPYIPEISFEEFKEGLIKMHQKYTNRSYKEMSDDDLKGVSGGAVRKVCDEISTYLMKVFIK